MRKSANADHYQTALASAAAVWKSLLTLSLFLFCAANSKAGPTQLLTRHFDKALENLQSVGPLAETNRLQLAFSLPLRNTGQLAKFLRQVSDPASPDYRHYLTSAQFTERFGPSENDYRAVIDFAASHGLKIEATHPNRLLLDVSGAVADINNALQVRMQSFQHPTEGRVFYAPDRRPTLELATPVLDISGLDNFAPPRPQLVLNPPGAIQNAMPQTGSGTNGTYMGKDFRAAYAPDTTLTGAGQTIGLLEFDGYTTSDITYYESLAGYSNVTLSNVLLDGFNGQPTGDGGEVEVSLDVEMAVCMAPGMSKLLVYEAGPYGNWEDVLNRMADDDQAAQLSCSWFQPGGGANAAAEQIFMQMAAQGQTFFSSSGDYDAYTALIPFPCDSTNIIEVGGTSLTTSGPGGSWVSEAVWNWGDGFGSGGGVSTSYGIPPWQTNINMSANRGSTTLRNVPDVALTANNVYVRADGQDHNVGGTSCAAPLWAGFTALVNQQAAISNRPPVGFINPALDVIGSGPNYSSCFHDITTGSDTNGQSPTEFFACAGYDLCTGWGVPAGQALISALAAPDSLTVQPGTGFTAAGRVGGPFTITNAVFLLANSGTSPIYWTLVNTSAWLTVSPPGGTLTPGGSNASVTIGLATPAYSEPLGTYTTVVTVSNITSGALQRLTFVLQVVASAPPTIVSQPSSQIVVAGSSAAFSITPSGTPPFTYQWEFDGSALSGATNSTLTLTNISPSQAGSYSVAVTNPLGSTNSSTAVLTVNLAPPCDPAPAGLISCWPGEGNANDMTGLNNGYLSNGVTFVTGEVGQAFNFNGSNFVYISNNASLQSPSVSVECWINLKTTSGFQMIASKPYGTTWGTWALWYYGGEIWGAITPGTSSQLLSYQWSPATNTWHHVAFAVNASNNYEYLFVDGWQVASVPYTGTLNYDSHPMLIGAGIQSGSPADFMDGAVDEFSIYNQALTPTQVNAIFEAANAGKCPLPPTIVAQPQGISAGLGGTATLSVSVAGPPPFEYQWTFDSTNIGNATNSTLTLTNLQSSQAGTYAVIVSNEGGSTVSSNAALGVSKLASPVFTTQPQSQTVLAGSTVTFSAGASGNVSYQWQFNGASIAGATNSSFILTNVQVANSGDYDAVVADLQGSATSSNAVLMVGIAPGIGSQPRSQMTVQGAAVSFSVGPTGTGPFNYQWSVNGSPLAGAGATLALANVQGSNGGTYSVIVTTPFGSIASAAATLSVAVPPAILTQPQSQIVVAGNSVTFSVAASGPVLLPQVTSGALQLWLKASAGLVTNSAGKVEQWLDASGNANDAAQDSTNQQPLPATSSGLGGKQVVRFNGIQDNVHGSYLYGPGNLGLSNGLTSFAVYDAFSATNSENVLWLIGVPGYSGGARCDDILGGDMTFSLWDDPASAPFAIPTNTCRIWIDSVNSNWTTLQMFDVSSNSSTNFTLPLSGATPPGAGYYVGGLNASLPDVGSGRNFNGDIAELICYQGALSEGDRQAVASYLEQTYYAANSGAGLTYQWQFNGTNLAGATNSSLTLTRVDATNGGPYSVIVGNSIGQTISSNAALTINSAPIFHSQPQSATVTSPGSAVFSVLATGSPAPTYQWQVNNINVAGANSSTLYIPSVVPTDGGSYTVVVSNTLGSVVSSEAILLVNYLTGTGQGQIQNLATTNLTAPGSSQPGANFNVGWVQAASQAGGPITLATNTITYTPPPGFAGLDYFNYKLSPTAGSTITGTVTVLVGASIALGTTVSDGFANLQFAGVPGKSYDIEASSNLVDWRVVGTVTAGPDGLFEFDGNMASWPRQCFFRTSSQ